MDDQKILQGFSEKDRATLAGILPENWGPPNDSPDFLNPSFIDAWLPLVKSPIDLSQRVERTLAKLDRMPEMRRYAAGISHCLFVRCKAFIAPEPTAQLGEDSGIFALLVAMSALPMIERVYQSFGIPKSYSDNVASWLGGTVKLYQAAHGGIPGHDFRQTPWLNRSILGRLFRIGRIEFLIHATPDWLPALFKSKRSGKVVALCRETWRITKEGWRLEDKDISGIRTSVDYYPDKICGTPIDPQTGRACHGKTIELPTSDYEDWLTANEIVPSMHIPGGEPLAPEAVIASMKEARAFFAKYLKLKIRACCCESWLLNPAWQQELPRSNIAAFQRIGHLCPLISDPKSGLFFVYGREDGDFMDYPVRTSLHRAFRHQYEIGEPFRMGAMVVDLDSL